MRKRPDIHRYDDLRLTDEQALHLWRVLFPTAPFPTPTPLRKAPLEIPDDIEVFPFTTEIQ